MKEILQKVEVARVVDHDLNASDVCVFDLSKNNKELEEIDTTNPEEYGAWKQKKLAEKNAVIGIGKYNEDRCIYRSKLFQSTEPRSLHLGIDINMPARSKVFSPLDGEVHSFKDNNNKGDYGPTIILRHNINGKIFHTLYGHLSKDSLEKLHRGMKVQKGQHIAYIGGTHENGGWSPHLHFQIIIDMEGKEGDYPGVAKPSEADRYLKNCPDPNLLLRIKRI